LARAVGTEGYAIYVPRGEDVAVPLPARITAFEEDLGPDGRGAVSPLGSLERENLDTCVFPRSIIVAEAGSRVTVVEDFRSVEGVGPYFSAGLTEVFVGRGAEVTLVSLQDWSEETWNFHTQRSHVEADGRIVTLTVHLGSKTTKANVEGVLVGPNAQSQMLGVLFGEQNQHFDLYTLQDHQAQATTSNLLFKTALRDEAKSIYSGLIRVDEGVVGADAYQANRNLLLSDKAKADSQPMLEILNNDVRCTHGATMGPVDAEQLFYLQARGLPQPEAERMVVQGFFEQALDQVRDESVRTWIHDRIAEKIGGVE
jgi:Fe-S cluster assembly protein SufD